MLPEPILSDSVPLPAQPHELALSPACFAAVEAGFKPFVICPTNFSYQPGAVLHLREADPHSGRPVGRTLLRTITDVQLSSPGLAAGWCILGFSPGSPLPAGVNDTRLW